MFSRRLIASLLLPVLLAVYWVNMTNRDRFQGCRPMKNWEHRHFFESSTVVEPSSLSDIVAAVNFAREHGKRVSVVGVGHSYADIAVPDDSVSEAGDGSTAGMSQNGSVLICMRCYSGMVNVDTSSRILTVLGGTTIDQLIEVLDQHDLALDVIPTVTVQTIAGALATGTHGQGITHGNLATLVTEIEMVLPSGKVVTASADENSDIFYGGVISIGALGIITQIKIQAVPKYNLRELTVVMPSAEVLDQFSILMTMEEYVKFLVEFHTGQTKVFACSKTHSKARNNPNRLKLDLVSGGLEVLQYITSFFPATIPTLMHFLIHYVGVFSSGDRVGSWHEILKIPHYIPRHLEAEYAVPVENAPAAVKDILEFVKKIQVGSSQFNEIRCAAGDKFWLSNSYNHTVCHLTLLLYGQDHRKEDYFGKIGEVLLKYGARPHWAKFYTLSETQLKTVYPKWNDFVELKRSIDPTGMFCNAYLRRLFSESALCA